MAVVTVVIFIADGFMKKQHEATMQLQEIGLKVENAHKGLGVISGQIEKSLLSKLNDLPEVVEDFVVA